MVACAKNLFTQRCEPAEFVESMSHAINGVCIVTTNGPHGRFGLTVSSMTSVSASPPLLLVCINRESVVHDAIRGNGRFTVNLLGTSQETQADRFAGRGDDPYVFDDTSWTTTESIPRLRGATAWFDCCLSSAVHAGSHSIFIGEVVETHSTNQTPLLYTNRRYGRPATLN